MPEPAHEVELDLFVRTFFSVRPPDRVMRQFRAIMRPLRAAAGTVLFERGSPCGELYLIAEGTVVMIGEDDSRWVFEGQSLIGVVDATLNRPHVRRAIVERQITGVQISFDDYSDVLEDNFDFAKSALERGAMMTHQTQLHLAPDRVFAPPSVDEALVARAADKRPLEMVERLMVLYRTSMFEQAPIQPMVTLATLAEEEIWNDGDLIFEEGRTMHHLRFVAAGKVVATRVDPEVRAAFGPGDLLGSSASIGFETYQYTMRAHGPTRTLRITKEDLYDVIEDHFGVARALFAHNAKENERVRPLLMTLETQTMDLKQEPAVL